MDHRQLELFIAVAERMNVTDAADSLGMTQPGLSKSLHRLQQELGARLYHRSGRGIELTEAGRLLLRRSLAIRAQIEEARAEVAGIATGLTGHGRIGAGPSWLVRQLPDAIAVTTTRHSGMRYTVKSGFPDQLIRLLRAGELDVVVGALPENRHDPDLRFTRLTADTIHVVARAEHALSAKPDRVLADYAAQRWVLPGRQELVRRRLNQAFASAGLPEPLAVVEADSLSLMLATLRLTDCLGLTTAQLLAQDQSQGIVAVDHELLRFPREAGVVSRRHIDLPPSITLVVAELRRVASKQRMN